MWREGKMSVVDDSEAYLEAAGLLDQSGSVFYSGASTLGPGPIYLLGLNPGGSGGATLVESLNLTRVEHNCYLDEAWAPGGHVQPVGKSILQRRVQHLCERLGLDTRKVPASNLAFTRSTRVGTHDSFDASLEICLPVHRIAIEAISPRFLMTFGALENFKKAAKLSAIESRLAEHGNWKAHRGTVEVFGRVMQFGNIPHMSLWASDQRESVVDWAIARYTD